MINMRLTDLKEVKLKGDCPKIASLRGSSKMSLDSYSKLSSESPFTKIKLLEGSFEHISFILTKSS